MAGLAALRLRKTDAEKRIHEIAKDSYKVKLSGHARERMAERDIVQRDVDRALRGGYLLDEPEPGKHEGEWKCKMVLAIKGRRDLGVVVVLRPGGSLKVKTVEWED